MAFFTKFITLHTPLDIHRQILPQSSADYANYAVPFYNFLLYSYASFTGNRWLSTNTESSTQSEFAGSNAYDLLGVSQTSSFAEIKASFRKLAKETHPDVTHSHSDSSNTSKKFIQILAAYEILSDSEKRAHYDRYLLSQRVFVQRHSINDPIMYSYVSHRDPEKQMEVVEWLKWYRYTIKDILAERRVTAGSGYFDVLERDFYSAIHAAYYGPEIESTDLLPDRFEAEERSIDSTPEVLHLVSGRDLFGIVCLTNKVPELSQTYNEKLTSFVSRLCESVVNISQKMNSDASDGVISQKQSSSSDFHTSDAYDDLELHVSGRRVAVATRVPPRCSSGIQDEDSEDQIHVYLTAHEDTNSASQVFTRDYLADFSVGSRIPLGTITGLGTSPEEGSCYVYNNSGMKTHVIMKHRTLLVKHMHWYEVGDKVSVCECRCSRARLPPSRFWLFEPRSAMHDIGGWYVETFGRDKKGRTVPSQRYWDGLDTNEQLDKRVHPAMYLLALAYRTLDIENSRRRKQTVKSIVEAKMFKVLNWSSVVLDGGLNGKKQLSDSASNSGSTKKSQVRKERITMTRDQMDTSETRLALVFATQKLKDGQSKGCK
ncbi:Chaperone DnaJ-domain superfamily protein [Forsythia ovata]|uniref:Chaperone DnaJ-domain superfamily protein n=1 Tax=Forsythia ovata TaxID=205694 RepID=A0ABD1UV12_9LAMI